MIRKRPRHQRFEDPLLDICWAAVDTLDRARQYMLNGGVVLTLEGP